MSLERRNGPHPSEFSREIRDDQHGGTIPLEWGCTVVDLDRLYVLIAESLVEAAIEGRLWMWYKQSPLDLIALVELKTPHDRQQSWAVTKLIVQRLGIPGFCVVRRDDGSLVVYRRDGTMCRCRSTREFVDHEIRPLYEMPF